MIEERDKINRIAFRDTISSFFFAFVSGASVFGAILSPNPLWLCALGWAWAVFAALASLIYGMHAACGVLLLNSSAMKKE